MQGPVIAPLENGRRLHLNHGPIDLIIGADGAAPEARSEAFEAAAVRFQSVLQELVDELPELRVALRPSSPAPAGRIAQRMFRAASPFSSASFLTPMIAVAGAVADEMLDAMRQAAPLLRAYVNNGGDIAVHVEDPETYSIGISDLRGTRLGTVNIDANSRIGGIATSGSGGRSFSFGIAESVTVLARDAAAADAAATLVANAVDLPDNPGILRKPANLMQPDSDLGARLVVTGVPDLTSAERNAALESGRLCAEAMVRSNHIIGAALFLQGHCVFAGHPSYWANQQMESLNA